MSGSPARLDKRGLRNRRLENAFLWLEDPGRATQPGRETNVTNRCGGWIVTAMALASLVAVPVENAMAAKKNIVAAAVNGKRIKWKGRPTGRPDRPLDISER